MTRFRTEYATTFPSPSTVDWLHRNRHENGLAASGALVKVQGRWYVWPERFFAWFDAQSEAA